MIRIIASQIIDGRAFVEDGDKVFLIRPPYIPDNISESSKTTAGLATAKHGFEEEDIEFKSYGEVIEYLTDEFLKKQKEMGIPLPSLADLKDILRFADKDIILHYIEKIENELIPEKKFEVVEELCYDLLGLQVVLSSDFLTDELIRLIKLMGEKKKNVEEEDKIDKIITDHFSEELKKNVPEEK